MTRNMVLFRFSNKAYLEAMRDTGAIRLNSLKYFSRTEAELRSVRRDPDEGIDEIRQDWDVEEILLKGRSFKMAPATAMRMTTGHTPYQNVFCTFAIGGPSNYKLPVDKRNFEFGDSFLMITNSDEFGNRLIEAIGDSPYAQNFVKYLDFTTYSGRVDAFTKSDAFAYQNEFRFVVMTGSDKPLDVELGSLADITTPIYRLDKINELVEIDYKRTVLARTSNDIRYGDDVLQREVSQNSPKYSPGEIAHYICADYASQSSSENKTAAALCGIRPPEGSFGWFEESNEGLVKYPICDSCNAALRDI